jgi:hypothetical protein
MLYIVLPVETRLTLTPTLRVHAGLHVRLFFVDLIDALKQQVPVMPRSVGIPPSSTGTQCKTQSTLHDGGNGNARRPSVHGISVRVEKTDGRGDIGYLHPDSACKANDRIHVRHHLSRSKQVVLMYDIGMPVR